MIIQIASYQSHVMLDYSTYVSNFCNNIMNVVQHSIRYARLSNYTSIITLILNQLFGLRSMNGQSKRGCVNSDQ